MSSLFHKMAAAVDEMRKPPEEAKQPSFTAEMQHDGGQSEAGESGVLAPNTQHQYFSKGSFNCLDALKKMLAYTGPAKVIIATWKINEEAARALLRMKEEKQITWLVGLIDFRMRSMDPQVFQLVQGVFDALVLSPCHAKVTVVTGAENSAVLLTSANYTNNPRWEFGLISTLAADHQFYQKSLQNALEDGTEHRAAGHAE